MGTIRYELERWQIRSVPNAGVASLVLTWSRASATPVASTRDSKAARVDVMSAPRFGLVSVTPAEAEAKPPARRAMGEKWSVKALSSQFLK